MAPNLDEILAGGSASFRKLNAGLAAPLSTHPSAVPGQIGSLAPVIPDAVSEPVGPSPLVSLSGAEERGPGPTRERPRLEISLLRVHLLDVDNRVGSCKPIIDALVAAKLIPGDREDQVQLEVRQTKVRTYREEGTGVRIVYR